MKGATQLEQQGTRAFQAYAPWLLNKADTELRVKLGLVHEQTLRDETAVRAQQSAWQNDRAIQGLQALKGYRQSLIAQKQIEDAMLGEYRKAQEAGIAGHLAEALTAQQNANNYRIQYLGILRGRLELAKQTANDPAKDINALDGAIKSAEFMMALLQSGAATESYAGELGNIQKEVSSLSGIRDGWINQLNITRQSPPPPPPGVGAPTPPPASIDPAKWTGKVINGPGGFHWKSDGKTWTLVP